MKQKITLDGKTVVPKEVAEEAMSNMGKYGRDYPYAVKMVEAQEIEHITKKKS